MKPASFLTMLLMLVVAAAHLTRLALRIPVTIGALAVPMWVSLGGFVVPLALAIGLWRERHA